ncbi:HIT family protein [Actinoplanes sp. NPDC051851]|uniref:HIT family protein n=1 Tax=Actinoplanes sp. NPDC051851 TaxID=3154753 RepID=UPI003427C43A
MDGCVFCRIIEGESPAYRVLEDEHCLAFLDIAPASPGHCLVVPRRHVRDLWEISDETHQDVSHMVHRVAALLRTALAPDGMNVNNSTGEAGGQEVPHFHTHVVPRWHGDSLRPIWAGRRATPGDLERILSKLRDVRL